MFRPVRFSRRTPIFVILFFICGVFATTSVQASDAIVVLSSVYAYSCDSDELRFNALYIFPETQAVTARTIVEANGQVYGDRLDAGVLTAGALSAIWSVSDSNTGGTQTANFPLPSGTPVLVRMILMNANYVPIWQTTLLLSQCDAGLMLFHQTGPVTQLLLNEGFETTGAKPTLASKWTHKVDDDVRVCNGTTTVSHTGECAFRFKGKNNVTTNISQVYNYKPIGGDGDQVSIKAWIDGINLAPGSTIKATLKFPTLPNKNVKIDIPAGNQMGYTSFTSNAVNILEPIKSVKFQITKVGKGTLFVDDVALLVAENAALPTLLTLPAAPDSNPTPLNFDGLRGLN